jgi:hypothetical protein
VITARGFSFLGSGGIVVRTAAKLTTIETLKQTRVEKMEDEVAHHLP